MLTRAQAKREILRHFPIWAAEQRFALDAPIAVADALSFYRDLRRRHTELFEFTCAGERWDVVHGWLIEANYAE